MLSALACLGRHTVTGHIATSGHQFDDWSADYRLYSKERLDSKTLFDPIRHEILNHLDAKSPAVVALDDTRLKKWSKHTPGVRYRRDPLGPKFRTNLILSQRFIQASMGWSNEQGQVRMIPIDFCHAPTVVKPKKNADESVWKAYWQAKKEHVLSRVGANRIRMIRQALDEREGMKDRRLCTVVDGGYTNGTFLKNLPERTDVIGRIRGDAKLYFLPDRNKKYGRRRVYGNPAPTPEQLRKDESVPWKEIMAFACGKEHCFRIKTISPVRWRSTGKTHDFRIVVIAPLGLRFGRNSRGMYKRPGYLVCTNTTMSLHDILQFYLWRWDIEVNFRDEKTLLGVGQAQVHHPKSVESVPALSVAAYAALLTAATDLYGFNSKFSSLPSPKWQQYQPMRASTQRLISQLRNDLWGHAIHFSHFADMGYKDTKSVKCHPELHSALFYGAASY